MWPTTWTRRRGRLRFVRVGSCVSNAGERECVEPPMHVADARAPRLPVRSVSQQAPFPARTSSHCCSLQRLPASFRQRRARTWPWQQPRTSLRKTVGQQSFISFAAFMQAESAAYAYETLGLSRRRRRTSTWRSPEARWCARDSCTAGPRQRRELSACFCQELDTTYQYGAAVLRSAQQPMGGLFYSVVELCDCGRR